MTETGNDNKRQIPRIDNDCSKLEVLSRISQTAAALTELKLIWRDDNIALGQKVKLMHTLPCHILKRMRAFWNEMLLQVSEHLIKEP